MKESPKRRGRPLGKTYDFNINLPVTKEVVRLMEGALLPKQSRTAFIRKAIDQALNRSPDAAAEPRRKGAAATRAIDVAAPTPLQGRD
jgi:hypothetical protein